MAQNDEFNLIRSVFFPHVASRSLAVEKNGLKFVYYTSASTAYKILTRREIWLRNATTMNDLSEVRHGVDLLWAALRGAEGARLIRSLDACDHSLGEEALSRYRAWVPGFIYATYMACVSEHPPGENELGRLSMWRAYGGDSGVAIVMNPGVFLRPSDALGAYTSPVEYFNSAQVAKSVDSIAANVEVNCKQVAALGRERISGAAFSMLRYAAVSIKHEAFREEQEWRIVASPLLSERVRPTIEDIGEVPQRVVKIRLEDVPAEGLTGLSPPSLIDRILVGPCEFSSAVAGAMFDGLTSAGVDNPHERVISTDIPLRRRRTLG